MQFAIITVFPRNLLIKINNDKKHQAFHEFVFFVFVIFKNISLFLLLQKWLKIKKITDQIFDCKDFCI